MVAAQPTPQTSTSNINTQTPHDLLHRAIALPFSIVVPTIFAARRPCPAHCVLADLANARVTTASLRCSPPRLFDRGLTPPAVRAYNPHGG